ncbi:MAG: ribonuclease III [Opitutales bacterium]|jgi:ribonuclease-3
MPDDQTERPVTEPLPEAAQASVERDCYAAFQQRIGYAFRDRRLLVMALTHPSWAQQHDGEENNQRLEFLGDSVLSLVLASELYGRMPDKREGVLTHSRAALAKRALLSALALELGVDAALGLSESEERNGGRARDSILEDTLESIVGAVFLDSDFEVARSVVLGWYGDLRERLEGLLGSHNPKGQLQELVQPRMGNEAITYTIVEEEGPPHLRTFRVRVDLCGKAMGEGSGASKKEAEENAARVALEAMQGEELK